MAEPLRILILEDNPADAEFIQFELEEAGFVFISKVVKTEQDFLHELQAFSPDLILSDYDLPKYNGARALSESRKRCPDTPFILVTGAVTEDRAIDILTQGAKDYVLKTRLEQRLAPAVRRALTEADEHRARKQAEAELREAHKTLEERVLLRTAELEAEMQTRRKTEEALEERVEELQRLLDVVPAAVWIANDPNCLTITGNRLADQFYEAGSGENVSATTRPDVRRFFDRDGRELAAGELPMQVAAAANLEVRDAEIHVQLPSGRRMIMLGNAVPLRDERGEVRGGISAFIDITARKKTEQALHESEESLRLALEAARMASWDWHIPTGNVIWNEMHYRMMGYKPGEVQPTYQTWADRVHPDDLDAAQSEIQKSMAEGLVYTIEFRTLWPDGTIRFLEARGEFEYDKTNQPLRCHGVMLDITERRLAEQALRDSEKQYRALFNGMTEGFAIHEIITDEKDIPVDYRFLDINQAFEILTGLKREDVVGKTHNEVLPGDDPKWLSMYGAVALTGEPVQFENYSPALKRHYEVMAYRPAPRQFAVIFMDITKRKQAEEALRENESLLQAITDNIPDGIFLKDRESRLLFANCATQAIIGKPVEQMLGKDDLAHYADPAVGRDIMENDRRIMDSGRTEVVEEIGLTPEGYRTYLSTKTPFRDARGNITGILGICRDITQQKKIEEDLRENERRFRTLTEEMSHFVWEAGADGVPLYANKRFYDYTGLNLEQTQAGGWIDVQHPDDAPKVEAAWRRAITNHTEYGVESRFREAATGQYRWFRIKGSPVRDQAGKIFRWVGTCTDIHEQKQAEDLIG
jgi:PAS domain S-box-containing protein